MEPGCLHDVGHAHRPEDLAVGVDDRRRIVGPPAVPLEEVDDGDDAQLPRQRRENVRGRTGDGLRLVQRLWGGRPFGQEPEEGELGEDNYLRPRPGGLPEGRDAAPEVVRPIGGGVLLDERDLCGQDFPPAMIFSTSLTVLGMDFPSTRLPLGVTRTSSSIRTPVKSR